MAENFKRRQEEKELIRKFEEELNGTDNSYFELESYETIISFYINNGKWPKAIKACNVGQ